MYSPKDHFHFKSRQKKNDSWNNSCGRDKVGRGGGEWDRGRGTGFGEMGLGI
jgi:hypothetical protein